jgi:hypothetical protein
MDNLAYAQQRLMERRRELGARPETNGRLEPIANLVGSALGAAPMGDDSPLPIPDASVASLGDLDPSWHPQVGQAIEAARSWQRRRQKQIAEGKPANASLVLLSSAIPGDPSRTGYGCGKTHIARACLWTVRSVIDGRAVAPGGQFFPARELIYRLGGETRACDEIHGEIVVVDDVGTEGLIPFVRQDEKTQEIERHARFLMLMNRCYQGHSLILTANMTIDKLADYIGGRAWSRLLEMAPSGAIVDLTGVPDYRRASSGR